MPTRSRWRRIALALAAAFVAAQVVWWYEPLLLFSLLERLAPGMVWRVPTDQPVVALSFDDGPSPAHTPLVLRLLAEHDARATFFLIGERAAAHPALVDAIRAGGHEVGNHYLRRGTALADDLDRFEARLLRAEQIIRPGNPKLFRPPGGLAWPSQLRKARTHGYTPVLGSAYPHDPARPPVWYIKWLVAKNMTPGAIVILHDGIADPSRTIRALPAILVDGQRRGIRFVTVGELLRLGTGRQSHQTSSPPCKELS